MSTAKSSETTDEPTQKNLQFEIIGEFDRSLTHRKDEPDWLKKRLSVLNKHGTLTIETFNPDEGFVMHLGVDELPSYSLTGDLTTLIKKTLWRYNRRTDGDTVHDAPKGRRVSKRAIRMQLEGKDRFSGNRPYPSKEKWERSGEIVEKLDTEDAPILNFDIHVRTLDGPEKQTGMGEIQ